MSDPPRLLDIRSLGQLFRYITLLLTDKRYFSTLATYITLGDVLLTQLIVRFVPYTEIDWETYMYQLELYMKGERDYALIEGPTGPLVYPAGHVWIHYLLYALTNSGKDIRTAQQILGLVYITSLVLTCRIYRAAGGIPNWLLLLLPLSKRLHSIFVLRLFNDCWAVVGAQVAIWAFAGGFDTLAVLLYGIALSVKMSVLLYLPGILVILFRRGGPLYTAAHVYLLVSIQALIGFPFLRAYPQSYVKYSYELTRVFLYKWTVNWRFLSEESFLSPRWAFGLLLGHLVTLVLFGWFKWCRRDGGVLAVLERGFTSCMASPALAPLSADGVITILFTSNLIGILFARSLHYQFYSWYAQQLPFLAWRTQYPVWLKLALLLGIEYAWNVFPSTPLSSGVLCFANAALVVGIFFGYPEGRGVDAKPAEKSE